MNIKSLCLALQSRKNFEYNTCKFMYHSFMNITEKWSQERKSDRKLEFKKSAKPCKITKIVMFSFV